MSQHELELILMRELASHLRMPIFVVRPDGDLLFYNEPAEALLGLRFDETGAMPVEDWGTRFVPTDAHGNPLDLDDLPLVQAMTTHQPAHGDIYITGSDGVRRHLEITGIPLDAAAGRLVGAAALFWEVP
jgi:PAS domain-containing protein